MEAKILLGSQLPFPFSEIFSNVQNANQINKQNEIFQYASCYGFRFFFTERKAGEILLQILRYKARQ